MSDPPNQPQWHHSFPFWQHLLHETKSKLNQPTAPTLLYNITWYLIVDYGLCLYPCQPPKHATLHPWPHTWTSWWVLMALERSSFAPWKHLEIWEQPMLVHRHTSESKDSGCCWGHHPDVLHLRQQPKKANPSASPLDTTLVGAVQIAASTGF